MKVLTLTLIFASWDFIGTLCASQSDGYGAPAASYGAPAPAPSYEAPAASYGAPAPSGGYAAPSTGYGYEATSYEEEGGFDLTAIIIPILILIGLSLLFPGIVFVNVRKRREAIEGGKTHTHTHTIEATLSLTHTHTQSNTHKTRQPFRGSPFQAKAGRKTKLSLFYQTNVQTYKEQQEITLFQTQSKASYIKPTTAVLSETADFFTTFSASVFSFRILKLLLVVCLLTQGEGLKLHVCMNTKT